MQEEQAGTRKFNREFEKCIKTLMKRDYDPTPETIFGFIRAHPGDYPFITSRIAIGLENHLKIYLYLWGKMRNEVTRRPPSVESQA